MKHDHSRSDAAPKCFWGSRYSIGLVLLGAIAAYFLLSEHRAHVLGTMPLLVLLLLACPLIHLFMHRGHAHGHEARADETREAHPPTLSSAGPTPPKRGDEK